MADRIKITTADLESQATRLSGLGNQMEDIRTKADIALSLMEDALSSKFTSNMDKKGKTLLKNLKSLKNSLNTGAKVATQCATSYRNADKVLRDVIGDSLPNDVKNSSTSAQSVVSPVDKSVYDQTAYSQFMEHYDYDYDGDIDYINTGCVITSCAYALTLMGIVTTPLQAYERSGGCGAVYNAISQNQAYIRMDQPISQLNEMAKKAKTDKNTSPLMLRVNGNTHTVVLEDIEMDANGNITKYIVFDPYRATTKEYTSISQMNVTNFDYYTRA